MRRLNELLAVCAVVIFFCFGCGEYGEYGDGGSSDRNAISGQGGAEPASITVEIADELPEAVIECAWQSENPSGVGDERKPVAKDKSEGDKGENDNARVVVVPDAGNVVVGDPVAENLLTLDIQEAVLFALERNVAFQIDRLSPRITETSERAARADFDPVLSGSLTYADGKDEEDTHNTANDKITRDDSLTGAITLEEFFPTGTTVRLNGSRLASESDSSTGDTASRNGSYDVTVTQSLLRGFGPAANLATLRQARLDTRISRYELRGVAEALISEVESAYLDCILAERSIAIYEQSLEIARQQIDEVKTRINVGNMAETELVASEAELASRREDLIDARGQHAKNRIAFLRLVNPGDGNPWKYNLKLASEGIEKIDGKIDDVESHVLVGLKKRPDLNQARLSLKKGEIEIVRTRNGLLPKLDLFLALGGTSYANSFNTAADKDGRKQAFSAGVAMEYALGNRSRRASHEKAQLSLQQSELSLGNMEQLVQVDIRTAYIEVERSREQVKATAATRKLREESLRTEQEKFRVGQSTSIIVAQAWRDLVESQIAEISAVIAQRKALLDLYLKEGSLLERRGISSDNR